MIEKHGGMRNYGLGEKGGLGIPEKEWEIYWVAGWHSPR